MGIWIYYYGWDYIDNANIAGLVPSDYDGYNYDK